MSSDPTTTLIVLGGLVLFTIGLLRIIRFFFDASPYTN